MELCCKSRKEREAEERRKYIMDVAEHLFATKGYHNTSVSDIAREAEFGIGTLYKYFKDKDTLFEEIILDRMEDYFERIGNALSGDKEPIEKLKDYINAYVYLLAERREFFKILFTYVEPMLVENEQQLNFRLLNIRERNMEFFDILDGIITEGIEKKQLRDVDPGYFASALYGAHISVYYLQSFRNPDGNWDKEEMESSINKIIFDDLLLDKKYR